jgi:hypothetical protein
MRGPPIEYLLSLKLRDQANRHRVDELLSSANYLGLVSLVIGVVLTICQHEFALLCQQVDMTNKTPIAQRARYTGPLSPTLLTLERCRAGAVNGVKSDTEPESA